MWEILGGLCLASFLLFFFALVGHLLWEAGRWTLQSLFPSGRSAPPASQQRCPGCDRLATIHLPHCVHCGLRWNSATARELADLAATERQLALFQRDKALSDDILQSLVNQINQRRQRLRRPETGSVPIVPVVPAPEREPTPLPEPEPAPILVPATASESGPIKPRVTTSATPIPTPRRRSVTDVLAAFMEERNILWGELVGGLLIVGCSIALVISLWQTLQENPLYQFGIFVTVTAALFGAGLYTLRHWKLEATSRGLLVIATLLVPLNLLALTTAQAGGPLSLTVVLAEGLGLAIFAGLLTLAGNVLAPQARWAYVGAILGISASQLLVPRILGSRK